MSKTNKGNRRSIMMDLPITGFLRWVSVLVRNLREGPCWVIEVVSKRLGPVTYEVEVGGQVWKRHTDQVMAYKGSMGSEGIGGATNMTEDPPVLPVVPTVAAGVVMPEVVRCLLLASPPR